MLRETPGVCTLVVFILMPVIVFFLFSDPSLNPNLLIPVFTTITGDWQKIGRLPRTPYTTVPDARANVFRKKFGNLAQLTAEAGKYYSFYHHDPSWKDLSVALYRAGETKALEVAKPYVPTVTGILTNKL